MKRYQILIKNGIKIPVETVVGEWANADIAQNLYDALENILNDESLDIKAIDKIQAQEALKNADKE